MTKVIHLASSGVMGGAEWVIFDILAGVRDARPDWDLGLIVPRAGALAERAAALGVRPTILQWRSPIERLGDAFTGRRHLVSMALGLLRSIPSAALYIRDLRRMLAHADPDIIHAHGFKMQLFALWARPRRARIVLHLHDYIGSRPLMSRLFRAQPLSRATAVAISRSIAKDAERVVGTRMPIVVIHNGIDLERWRETGPAVDLDGLSGLETPPPGTLRVGLVGTMARWKGHETFIRAMSLLPPALPVRGYIIGGSIYRTERSEYTIGELEAMVAELGLRGRVGFTGLVAEPAAAMRHLDVVVHASVRDEPFGRVIVEGMALGRAVITSAMGGAAELIVEGESAVTFQAGDGSALAARIVQLAGDPAMRRSLGMNGQARVRQLFGRHDMTTKIVNLYEHTTRTEPPVGG